MNSYFPKYCSMRKGLMCMVQESGKARGLASSAKLTGPLSANRPTLGQFPCGRPTGRHLVDIWNVGDVRYPCRSTPSCRRTAGGRMLRQKSR